MFASRKKKHTRFKFKRVLANLFFSPFSAVSYIDLISRYYVCMRVCEYMQSMHVRKKKRSTTKY